MTSPALYITTILVWGSTWMAIEFQLGSVAPEVSIAYRYALASLLLFGWCLGRGLRLQFGLSAHGRFALLGLLLFSLNYVLTYYAQEHITSALTAIAFSTMLWMNIINARLFFGTRVGRGVIGGSLLGIVGIVVLFLPEMNALTVRDTTVFGTGLALTGAFVASLGNMVSQAAQNKALPIVQSNAWGMFYGAVLTASTAWLLDLPFMIEWTAGYLVSLAYLAVFGSIVGFGTYLTLLGRIGAARAGYTMVMFPVVAILISLGMGETQLSWDIIAGVVLVLVGNVLVLKSRRTPAIAANRLPGTSGSCGHYVLQKPE